MDFLPVFINAVKTTMRDRITARHMITVIGKLFAGGEAWGFAHDLVAFDHELAAVGVSDDPLPAEKRNRLIRSVLDRDEIDKRVRLVGRKRWPAVVIGEFIKAGGKTGHSARAR